MPALPFDITLSQFVRLERPTRPIAIGNIQQKPQTMRFVHGLRYIHSPTNDAPWRFAIRVHSRLVHSVPECRGLRHPVAWPSNSSKRMGVSEANPVIASHFSAWGKGQ